MRHAVDVAHIAHDRSDPIEQLCTFAQYIGYTLSPTQGCHTGSMVPWPAGKAVGVKVLWNYLGIVNSFSSILCVASVTTSAHARVASRRTAKASIGLSSRVLIALSLPPIDYGVLTRVWRGLRKREQGPDDRARGLHDFCRGKKSVLAESGPLLLVPPEGSYADKCHAIMNWCLDMNGQQTI